MTSDTDEQTFANYSVHQLLHGGTRATARETRQKNLSREMDEHTPKKPVWILKCADAIMPGGTYSVPLSTAYVCTVQQAELRVKAICKS